MEQILKIVVRNIDMLRSCNISRHGEKHWKMAKRSSDLFLGNSTLWRFQSGYFIVTRSFLLPSRQLDNWRPKNRDREIEVHDRWNRPFLCSFQNSLLRAKCGSRTKDVTRYRGDAAISGIMVIRATVAYRRLIRSVRNSSVPRGRWSSLIGFRDFEYVPRKNSLDIARDFSNFPRAIPLFPPHFFPSSFVCSLLPLVRKIEPPPFGKLPSSHDARNRWVDATVHLFLSLSRSNDEFYREILLESFESEFRINLFWKLCHAHAVSF